MISHLIQVRGNNGICNMRYSDANVLVIDSDVKMNSIVIDGTYVTGTMILNQSFESTPETSYAYFSKGNLGPRTGLAQPTPLQTSLKAQYAVQASQFVALSDARVKTDIREANTETLDECIQAIPVRHWKYKDHIEKGSDERLGFVAQDVPDELAKYTIWKQEGYVPNIFRHAVLKTHCPRLGMNAYVLENHGLKKGDMIRVCTNTSTMNVPVIDVPSSSTFTLEIAAEKIFVYGTLVRDVMNIDYDALVAALIASHQRLSRRVAVLESKNNVTSTVEE